MKYTKEEFARMTETEYYEVRDSAAHKLAYEFYTAINSLVKNHPNLENTLKSLDSDLLHHDDIEAMILKKD